MAAKFKTGDKVRIVKYGSLIWQNKHHEDPKLPFPIISENKDVRWLDMTSEIVGMEGVIDQVTNTQGKSKYSVNGIPQKHAWYNEDQLELI